MITVKDSVAKTPIKVAGGEKLTFPCAYVNGAFGEMQSPPL